MLKDSFRSASCSEIPHNRPTLGESSLKAVEEALLSGWIGCGPKVEALEGAFAEFIGVQAALATTSGTQALILALRALDIGPGDEVVIPDYSCIALNHAVEAVGARPILADCDPQTGNLDPEAVERKITPRCRAIVVVHTFGVPAEIDALLRFRIPLIEDMTHAVGAPVGQNGALSVCSTYATKLFTTGEGGLIGVNDPSLLSKLQRMRQKFGVKLSDLQAALGIQQLAALPSFLKRRKQLAERYTSRLKGLPVTLPPESGERVFYRYVVGVSPRRLEPLREFLRSQGIYVERPYPEPLHRILKVEGTFPGSSAFWEQALSLPLYPTLTFEEQNRIVEALWNFFSASSSAAL